MTPAFDIVVGKPITVEITCLNENGDPDTTMVSPVSSLRLKRNVNDVATLLLVTGGSYDAQKGTITFSAFTLSQGSADAANAYGLCVADLLVTVGGVDNVSELLYVRVRKGL